MKDKFIAVIEGKHMRQMFFVAATIALAGCAVTSDVIDTGNGTYMISAHAAPIRGGTAGANDIAYKDAQKFCAQKGGGLHAIVIEADARDVYQGSFGGNRNGYGGGVFAAGNTDKHFKCGT